MWCASFHSKPCLLSCRTRCHSPYVEIVVVILLMNSLYIMLAKAIGLWLVSWYGLPFLYRSTTCLVFQDVGICLCSWQCVKNNIRVYESDMDGMPFNMELGILSRLGFFQWPNFVGRYRMLSSWGRCGVGLLGPKFCVWHILQGHAMDIFWCHKLNVLGG